MFSKFIRPILVKIYYHYTFLPKIRAKLQDFYCEHIRRPDKEAMNKLRNLINDAKKNKQTIYVSFPLCKWDMVLFQRPQQMALAMSKENALVIYFEAPSPMNSPSLRKVSDNLYVTNQDFILSELSGALVSIYLSYRPEYFKRYLTKRFIEENKVFYEYVDHINEEICGKETAIVLRKRLEELKDMQLSFILATSQILYDELKVSHPKHRIEYIPNGVDTNIFDKKNKNIEKVELPKKLQDAIRMKKKIIGYCGAIAPWLWKEILLDLAEKRKDYFILMIGPYYGDVENFPELENFYCMGSVEHKLLPNYTKYFDASIIPFRLGDIAKSTSPLKLFEYFAIGKPVVVTSDMFECIRFEGVESASSGKEFIEKIDKVLSFTKKEQEDLAKKYAAYAKDNSWQMRAKALDKVFKSFKVFRSTKNT